MATTSGVSRLPTPWEKHPPPDILLVEDGPGELYLLRKGFATGPLPVALHSVPSVSEALAFLRQTGPYRQAPRPQLIVTSINLAGQSGFELLAAVKQDPTLRTIPVIVFSTYVQPEIIRKSYALGANSYITKPQGLDAFFGAIHTIMEYWFTVAVLRDPLASSGEPNPVQEKYAAWVTMAGGGGALLECDRNARTGTPSEGQGKIGGAYENSSRVCRHSETLRGDLLTSYDAGGS